MLRNVKKFSSISISVSLRRCIFLEGFVNNVFSPLEYFINLLFSHVRDFFPFHAFPSIPAISFPIVVTYHFLFSNVAIIFDWSLEKVSRH